MDKNKSGIFRSILNIIKNIPQGKVATYGQIAAMAGTQNPRLVGYALAQLNDEIDIPWFRVINSKGSISFPEGSEAFKIQYSLLQQDGVKFDSNNKINLEVYGWKMN